MRLIVGRGSRRQLFELLTPRELADLQKDSFGEFTAYMHNMRRLLGVSS